MPEKRTRFIRTAQAAPMGDPLLSPPGGGMPPLPPMGGPGGPPGMPPGGGGLPPLPGLPPPPGGPPGAPADGPKEKIGSALKSQAEILYDAEVTEMVKGSSKDANELAQEIWVMYGGNEDGTVDETKVGRRDPNAKNVPPEAEEKEQHATEKRRWERLPLGQVISDITSLQELGEAMEGIVAGTASQAKMQASPPAGPGGMPPMPMASLRAWIRIAAALDEVGQYEFADFLDCHFCGKQPKNTQTP